jgi:hypothetical protein
MAGGKRKGGGRRRNVVAGIVAVLALAAGLALSHAVAGRFELGQESVYGSLMEVYGDEVDMPVMVRDEGLPSAPIPALDACAERHAKDEGREEVFWEDEGNQESDSGLGSLTLPAALGRMRTTREHSVSVARHIGSLSDCLASAINNEK